MTGSINNNFNTFEALRAYESAKTDNKGGKVLLKIDSQGKMTAEKVSTFSLFLGFFGIGKGAAYFKNNQKVVLADQLNSTVIKNFDINKTGELYKTGDLNAFEDETTLKISMVKTMIRSLNILNTSISKKSEFNRLEKSISKLEKTQRTLEKYSARLDKAAASFISGSSRRPSVSSLSKAEEVVATPVKKKKKKTSTKRTVVKKPASPTPSDVDTVSNGSTTSGKSSRATTPTPVKKKLSKDAQPIDTPKLSTETKNKKRAQKLASMHGKTVDSAVISQLKHALKAK